LVVCHSLAWPGRRGDSDLPDGLFCKFAVQPSSQKYFASPIGRSSFIDCTVHPTEGRIAIVTNAGLDAMDADGGARRAALTRTAKSCGPDASAWRQTGGGHFASDGVNKPITGESAKETVKTIACGNAGRFR
jgi:hypothetical protein